MHLLEHLSARQREAYNLITDTHNLGGIAFWKVGTGKTRIAIASGIALLQECSMHARMIAVVCRREAFYDWRAELVTLQIRAETPEIEDLAKAEEIFNIDSFVLVSDGLLRIPKTIATLQQLIDRQYLGVILVDEGYLFCNPKSQRSKGLAKITSQIPTVHVSGSIMPSRDLTQIYGQAIAANKHKRITPTLTKFRQEYQIGIQGHYYAYYPKPGAYKKLMEKMAPFTHLYMPKKADRERVESIIKVLPNEHQLDLLKELKETMAVDGMFELKNAVNIILRGQQISNGWLKSDEGFVRYFESTKVARTIALTEEILAVPDARVVIWCAYREDIKRLKYEFELKTDIKLDQIVSLQSGEKFDVDGWYQGKYKICLATEASGSSINHFAQVPYGIYFSQDFKWLNLQQSQGRHDRESSKHPVCFYTFLHTNKTPDAQVFYTVKGSASSEKSFIAQFDVAKWMGEI